jgi:hypothetical protein
MSKAKILTQVQVVKVLEAIRATSRQPLRDELFVLFSFCCGLRAQEIACVELSDVTDAEGQLAPILAVRGGKYGKQRRMPMPSHLLRTLEAYLQEAAIRSGPLFLDQFRSPVRPNAVQRQLGRIHRSVGLIGASSNSGRRSFITRASRVAGLHGCSMEDIRVLAGHADLSTTQEYIEVSQTQRTLVERLWDDWRDPADRASLQKERWIDAIPPANAVQMHLGSKGAPYTPDGFRTEWNRLMHTQDADGQRLFARFRAERIVFHGLRKNAVINLLEAGCTEPQVGAIVNMSEQMVRHYSRDVRVRALARDGMKLLENRWAELRPAALPRTGTEQELETRG